MKKIVLLAVAITLTSIGFGYAMNAHQTKEHSKCEYGTRCSACNGTGWVSNGSMKCFSCKGTGANSSY
ncbi:MAG: hypothetical protein WCP35_07855 [Verrucomicrobiota bacterium]